MQCLASIVMKNAEMNILIIEIVFYSRSQISRPEPIGVFAKQL